MGIVSQQSMLTQASSMDKNSFLFYFQDSLIVIEEDLILSPDFLYVLALLNDVFRKDDTISAIQMWNPNGKDR